MINYIVETTFLLYGLLLLSNAQYLTCLILLILSLIFIMKGLPYKNSIIITIVLLLFITQYHTFFPSRDMKLNQYINEQNEYENENEKLTQIEGFKTINEKKEEREFKKNIKKEKRQKARLDKELSKLYAGYPRRYIKNKMKIDKKSKDWGEALSKWSLLKENLFMIFNMKN
jgi:hypothetical protein